MNSDVKNAARSLEVNFDALANDPDNDEKSTKPWQSWDRSFSDDFKENIFSKKLENLGGDFIPPDEEDDGMIRKPWSRYSWDRSFCSFLREALPKNDSESLSPSTIEDNEPEAIDERFFSFLQESDEKIFEGLEMKDGPFFGFLREPDEPMPEIGEDQGEEEKKCEQSPVLDESSPKPKNNPEMANSPGEEKQPANLKIPKVSQNQNLRKAYLHVQSNNQISDEQKSALIRWLEKFEEFEKKRLERSKPVEISDKKKNNLLSGEQKLALARWLEKFEESEKKKNKPFEKKNIISDEQKLALTRWLKPEESEKRQRNNPVKISDEKVFQNKTPKRPEKNQEKKEAEIPELSPKSLLQALNPDLDKSVVNSLLLATLKENIDPNQVEKIRTNEKTPNKKSLLGSPPKHLLMNALLAPWCQPLAIRRQFALPTLLPVPVLPVQLFVPPLRQGILPPVRPKTSSARRF